MDTVEAVYSAPLAREAIRALSGHPPRSRLYYLERAVIDPPAELKSLIFRVVLLQDAAFLYDQLPPRIRHHKIFGETFQQYRTDAIIGAQSSEHPVEMQLQVAMPLLSQQIKTQHELFSVERCRFD